MITALFSRVRTYTPGTIKKDLLAALAVTAIAVPESLGFAAIAGLPLEAGLYTALFAPLAYALLARSRRLIVGADSATAAVVAAGAGIIAASGTEEYRAAVMTLGLLVALFLLLLSIFRLGYIASLISRPVLIGLFAGIGLQLIIGKMPEMLGLAGHRDIIDNLNTIYENITSINWLSLTIAILVFGIILLARRTRIPGELVGLVAACLFAYAFNVGSYGVSFVGALPSGLPAPALWLLSPGGTLALIPTAASIALVILAQSATTIKSFADEHDEKVDVNRDLLALGVANAASAMGQGFVANGSPPRSLVSDAFGANARRVNLLTAGAIALILIIGSGIFAYIPEAALAAVVCAVGFKLIRYEEIVYLWRYHASEFAVAIVAMSAIALLGVRQGIIFAIVISLAERLRRQYRPRDQILLRDGVLSEWALSRIGHHTHHDIHPEGVLIYRFEGAIFFENADYFSHRLRRAIRGAKRTVHYAVVDAGAIDSIDYTSVEMLKQLYRHLSADNIKLGFAHVSPHLREQFDIYGVTDLVGTQNIYQTLDAVIMSRPDTKRATVDIVGELKLEKDSYIVTGGAVLEALDLRDTKDIDIIVSDTVYDEYRGRREWHEYRLDSGKKVLSKDGVNLMRSWFGYKLKSLAADAITVKGIMFASPAVLIAAKQKMGRRKDKSDIRLLETYLKRKSRGEII